jgi:hypothetical protein
MGMFYCQGCDRRHDSKDGEYNVTTDGKEYCDETLPEDATVECNNPGWHDVFGGVNLPTNECCKPFRPQPTPPTNPQTLIAMGDDDLVNVKGFGPDVLGEA